MIRNLHFFNTILLQSSVLCPNEKLVVRFYKIVLVINFCTATSTDLGQDGARVLPGWAERC